MSQEPRKNPEKTTSQEAKPTRPTPPTFLDSTWTWSSPSTWPLTIKLLPVFIAIISIYLAVAFPALFGDPVSRFLADTSCTGAFNYTFQIAAAKRHAEELATHDWEIGTAGEALLELLSPHKAVFGRVPFPRGKVPYDFVKMDEALTFVFEKVRVWDGPTIVEDSYSVSDPASLGVSAVMIGQVWKGWLRAAEAQKEYLLKDAPRYGNGAISHRVEVAELWSDAVHMVPPFLAYYGVATNDLECVREAVRQVELYREVLMLRDGERKELWRHIVGPSEMADDGAWSTGNGWAAYGMARVRATIAGWEKSKEMMEKEIAALDSYMIEIIDGAIRTDDHESGLLRNYLGDSTWFGETAGTALLAAAAYRLGMFMEQNAGRDHILQWADEKRRAVVRHVNDDGVARPAVHSLKHDQRQPFEGINPEGESFLLLMGAAWRDCVCAGVRSREG
ncbi:uncharacterized protein LTR77_008082 [Saxophila tyrrhenica]|uniref:Uncharacterized protein n=1 Tax=Saxophila tyrrhenica TaxID=1690608 RepID=A0AAV9P5S6_9PEZI|nr:hypothetical protein LTR77_008082 [Saxophila tyrrhenica]